MYTFFKLNFFFWFYYKNSMSQTFSSQILPTLLQFDLFLQKDILLRMFFFMAQVLLIIYF